MRLIVTGGGTGGHVYPALEIARAAADGGHDVMYFGSHRGQEKAVCEKAGIVFRGFNSEPFLGIRSLNGWKSGWNLFWAGQKAKRVIRHADVDVVFSTGGYSSSPVVSAARALEIPYVLLEQNSVPGRVNKGAGPDAVAVCTVFKETERHFRGSKVVRTGMPIRRELRERASFASGRPGKRMVLVMGGSQGAAVLNQAALAVAKSLGSGVRWLHLTGKAHFEEVALRVATDLSEVEYEVKPFLDGLEMADALASASVAVCRSGAGTVSELAAFRIPSVLIPFPAAHGDHQLHNAKELEAMEACVLVEQSTLSSERLRSAIAGWTSDESRRKKAMESLTDWDRPEATAAILVLLEEAAAA